MNPIAKTWKLWIRKSKEAIEDGRIPPCLWIGRINTVKWLNYWKQPTDSKPIPIKILMTLSKQRGKPSRWTHKRWRSTEQRGQGWRHHRTQCWRSCRTSPHHRGRAQSGTRWARRIMVQRTQEQTCTVTKVLKTFIWKKDTLLNKFKKLPPSTPVSIYTHTTRLNNGAEYILKGNILSV